MLLKRSLLLILVTLLALFAVLGCNQKKVVDHHSSQISLDWHGYYQGVLPKFDIDGIYTDLQLKEDMTFIKRTKKPGEDTKLVVVEGSFTWSKDGNQIIIADDEESETSTLAVQENRLVWLNIEGKEIAEDDREDYILTKIPGILVEKQWKIIKIRSKMVKITPFGENDYAYFHFSTDEKKFYGFSGCNFFRANYNITGDELSFTPIASTMMAGPNLEIEGELFDALKDVRTYEVKGSNLYLSDADDKIIITAKVVK